MDHIVGRLGTFANFSKQDLCIAFGFRALPLAPRASNLNLIDKVNILLTNPYQHHVGFRLRKRISVPSQTNRAELHLVQNGDAENIKDGVVC